MIIVSDTSPIINLAAIKQLELLHSFYGTITIPQAVYHEIAVKGREQAGSTGMQSWHWFKRYQVQNVSVSWRTIETGFQREQFGG